MSMHLVRSTTALAPARRPVVLVTGNDRDELAAWVAMLRAQGFEAHGAEGGRSALRRAAQSPPDVVVLDFRGRPSSGVSAVRQIREFTVSTLPKLLVATATSPIVLAQCVADYDAYIARPFDSAQLLRAIRALVVEPPVANAMPVERRARPEAAVSENA